MSQYGDNKNSHKGTAEFSGYDFPESDEKLLDQDFWGVGEDAGTNSFKVGERARPKDKSFRCDARRGLPVLDQAPQRQCKVNDVEK